MFRIEMLNMSYSGTRDILGKYLDLGKYAYVKDLTNIMCQTQN